MKSTISKEELAARNEAQKKMAEQDQDPKPEVKPAPPVQAEPAKKSAFGGSFGNYKFQASVDEPLPVKPVEAPTPEKKPEEQKV